MHALLMSIRGMTCATSDLASELWGGFVSKCCCCAFRYLTSCTHASKKEG